MTTFQEVIRARAVAEKARQNAAREAAAAEESAEREAGARRAVPFQATEARLQGLMDRDDEFSRYMQTHVDFKNMVPNSGIDVPKHPKISRDSSTSWVLAIIVKDGHAKLMLEKRSPRFWGMVSPAEAPAEVCEALQPVLEILQDETKALNFLLDKYGTPEENLYAKR